jgi:hypothetical protein
MLFNIAQNCDWPCGLQSHQDWLGTLGGIVALGLDTRREAIDVHFAAVMGGKSMAVRSVQITKGFKRVSCAAYVLMHAMMKKEPDDVEVGIGRFANLAAR